MRLWRAINIAGLALLVIGSVVLTNTVRNQHAKNHFLLTLTAQGNELEQTRLQLQKTKDLLALAEIKLEFLNQYKTAVQVTAFTGQGSFASGLKTAQSYAVPYRILPDDKVLNVALSPSVRSGLELETMLIRYGGSVHT